MFATHCCFALAQSYTRVHSRRELSALPSMNIFSAERNCIAMWQRTFLSRSTATAACNAKEKHTHISPISMQWQWEYIFIYIVMIQAEECIQTISQICSIQCSLVFIFFVFYCSSLQYISFRAHAKTVCFICQPSSLFSVRRVNLSRKKIALHIIVSAAH